MKEKRSRGNIKKQRSKKMNKSKIIKLITIVISAAVIIILSSSFAEANNYADEPWSFTVGPHGGTGYIVKTGRNKTDASSVYIKCDEGTEGKSFLGTAYGSNSADKGFFNCTYNGKASKSYSIKKDSVFLMTNYIYEAGYGYANVFYDAKYIGNASFSGVWSPDSI